MVKSKYDKQVCWYVHTVTKVAKAFVLVTVPYEWAEESKI